MKKHFQKVREGISELNRAMGEIAVASLNQRARGLEEAVKDGWFKHFLIGAGIVATGAVYSGLTNNNDHVAGVGYGIIVMSSIYAVGCYGIPYIKKRKDEITKRKL